MDDTPLPLTAHLAELRGRLFKVLAAWALGAAAAGFWHEEIFRVLLLPATQALGSGMLQAIAPTEIFFSYVKCALLAGLAFALPIIFWQIWAFIAPGLYPSEKRMGLPFALISTLLFAGGALFGHQLAFPLAFRFLAGFESDFVVSAWTLREVFALTTRLILAFGAGFEMPVLIFFLGAAGIVPPRRLLAGFKYAVLAVFIAAAILTPPDVVSQLLLAAPLLLLYLIGVGAAWMFSPRRDLRR